MHKKKVLIAEDDPAILEVMGIILKEAGYEVISVSDAEAILKEIQTNTPHIILMDIWMGGKDGGQIARQVKTDELFKHTPLIMISANTETESIALKAGADGFLQKPFNVIDLLSIVEKHIS